MTAMELSTLLSLLLDYAACVANSDAQRLAAINNALDVSRRLSSLLKSGDPDTITSDIPF